MISKTPRAGLLLLNGDIPDPELVRKARSHCRVLICADGGLKHAASLKLEPDFIVGDMDSLPSPLPAFRRAVYCCDFDENISDFEKSLRVARELGCSRIYVVGALGGRTDHALVNLSLIERYSEKLEIVLIDHGTARILKAGRHRLELPRGTEFSLLSAMPRAKISLSGARYSLRKEILEPGSRGLSNVAQGPLNLAVHQGRVWFMVGQRRGPHLSRGGIFLMRM